MSPLETTPMNDVTTRLDAKQPPASATATPAAEAGTQAAIRASDPR